MAVACSLKQVSQGSVLLHGSSQKACIVACNALIMAAHAW